MTALSRLLRAASPRGWIYHHDERSTCMCSHIIRCESRLLGRYPVSRTDTEHNAALVVLAVNHFEALVWYKRVWWALRNPTLAETLIGRDEAVKLRTLLDKLIEAEHGQA